MCIRKVIATFSILIFCVTQCIFCSVKNDNSIILTVYDFGINTTFYTMKHINPYIPFQENIPCKIAYVSQYADFETIENYSFYYNKRWYFYIESESMLKEAKNSLISENIDVYGIIIKNDEKLIKNANETDFPVFIIDEIKYTSDKNFGDLMKEYDFRNQTHNTFFALSYAKFEKIVPINYYMIISSSTFFLSLLLVVLYNVGLTRYHEQNSGFVLQKFFIFIPYFNVLLSSTIILEVFYVMKNAQNGDSKKIYIETALVTLNAVFRTLLWFFFFLVSSGWQVLVQKLTKDEMKSYIKIYVFIYISMCADQIIDSVSDEILGLLNPSEIKNFLYYLFIAIIITIRGKKTSGVLKRKILYASRVSNEFLPALTLKYKMIRSVIILSYINFVLYSATCFIHKKFCFAFDSDEFQLINYHVLDIVLVLGLCYIFRPMKFPQFFETELATQEREKENEIDSIYSMKIPTITELQNDFVMNYTNDFNPYELDSKVPLVVINPVFNFDPNNRGDNENLSNYLIDRIQIGYFQHQV